MFSVSSQTPTTPKPYGSVHYAMREDVYYCFSGLITKGTNTISIQQATFFDLGYLLRSTDWTHSP